MFLLQDLTCLDLKLPIGPMFLRELSPGLYEWVEPPGAFSVPQHGSTIPEIQVEMDDTTRAGMDKYNRHTHTAIE